MIFSNDDRLKEQAAYFLIKTDIQFDSEGGATLKYLEEALTPQMVADFLTLCKEIGETAVSIGGIIKPLQNEKAKAMLRVILYDAIYKAIF